MNSINRTNIFNIIHISVSKAQSIFYLFIDEPRNKSLRANHLILLMIPSDFSACYFPQSTTVKLISPNFI